MRGSGRSWHALLAERCYMQAVGRKACVRIDSLVLGGMGSRCSGAGCASMRMACMCLLRSSDFSEDTRRRAEHEWRRPASASTKGRSSRGEAEHGRFARRFEDHGRCQSTGFLACFGRGPRRLASLGPLRMPTGSVLEGTDPLLAAGAWAVVLAAADGPVVRVLTGMVAGPQNGPTCRAARSAVGGRRGGRRGPAGHR